MSGDSEIHEALVAERLHLCEFLGTLDTTAWESPSSCSGWTIHDVVAHLSLSTRTSTLDFAKSMIRHRGDFDEANATEARKRSAAFSPSKLIEQLLDHARSTKKSFGSSPADELTDVIVRAQDIARPLDRTHVTPTERAVLALDHVVASRWYPAKQGFLRAIVTATDANWSHGTGGETIDGSVVDLLLAGTGRRAALDRLTGHGIDTFRAHLDE